MENFKELAKAGDWETYVDGFYCEAQNFEDLPERHDTVVSRFRDKWATQAVKGFDAFDNAETVISENGKKAVFMKDGQPVFNLYLNEEGR